VVVIPDEIVSVSVVVVVVVGEYEGQVGSVTTEEMESAVSVRVVICARAAAASRASRKALVVAIILYYDYMLYVWYWRSEWVGNVWAWEWLGWKGFDEGSGDGTYRPWERDHGIMRGIVACHHK
jgi:hypothetical protein